MTVLEIYNASFGSLAPVLRVIYLIHLINQKRYLTEIKSIRPVIASGDSGNYLKPWNQCPRQRESVICRISFQSNICKLFFPGIQLWPNYRGAYWDTYYMKGITSPSFRLEKLLYSSQTCQARCEFNAVKRFTFHFLCQRIIYINAKDFPVCFTFINQSDSP